MEGIGKDMNVRKVRDWAIIEAIRPRIQRLSFPVNGFEGLETGSVSVPMPSLNKSVRNRLGVSRSVPCSPGRNRITERGRSERERDPRTNLTVGSLLQQNISTGAPSGRTHCLL